MGIFIIFLCMYFIQHCFICGLSDSTVSEGAGIEPMTVATSALAVRRSSHSATSHSLLGYISSTLATSHPHSLHLINTRYISSTLGYMSSTLATSHQHSATSHPHSATSHPHSATSHPNSATSHSYSATSHPLSATSYPHSTTSHPHSATSYSHSDTSNPVSATSYPHSATVHLIHTRLHLIHSRLHLIYTRLHLIHNPWYSISINFNRVFQLTLISPSVYICGSQILLAKLHSQYWTKIA